MNRGKGLFVAILFLLFRCGSVSAQRAYETFDRNRIQYKHFEWKYLSSENFDVYYYDNRQKIAQETIQYLETEFDRITDLLGYFPYQKTKIFLYNSITDQQQSNMGLHQLRYNPSGETVFIKPYTEIAHPGSLDEFKEELVFKISSLFVDEMMFGGSLTQTYTSSALLNLPQWFIDGISYYVAYGWDEEMDDYVRQLVMNKDINKAFRLRNKSAALVGQSIWNYIAEKYGKSNINNILNYTRIIRNEQKSIMITLGVPFKQLISDWSDYYKTMASKVAENYVTVADSTKATKQNRHHITFTTVRISPDGKNMAYAINDRGKYWIKVKSLVNGKTKTILSGGNRVIKQSVDNHLPLLNWSDDKTLGVIGVKSGKYIFWLYDVKSGSRTPRELERFGNIRSFSFSNNGRLMIMSADVEGQNDLFLLSSKQNRTKRLTNDIYDDLQPSFIPQSNTIIFSSNRPNDSVTTKVKTFENVSDKYNLFLYNIDTTVDRLKRITNTLSKDFNARAMDSHNFFYLSDQRGIVNLFRFNTQAGTYTQLSNFNSSIKDYDVNFASRTLAMIQTQNLLENIFVNRNFNFDRSVFTPVTHRKEILQARLINERRKKEPAKPVTLKDLINSRRVEKTEGKKNTPTPTPLVKEKKDTVVAQKKSTAEITTDNYSFDEEPAPKNNKPSVNATETPVAPKVPANGNILNTDEYTFDETSEQKKQQPNSTFLNRYIKAREVSKVQGAFPYQPKFGYDNIGLNFVSDQIRGFSLRAETQMNDMLENYRFIGGFQLAFKDLKSGDVFGEFQYLTHRVDFSVRFDRKVIYWQTQSTDITGSNNSENQKYAYQKIELGASYPISVRTRVSVKPFISNAQFVDRGAVHYRNQLTFYPSQEQFYSGAKVELVYDNSVVTGLNSIEGTRGKISVINYQALGNSSQNFSQAYIDLRHYQPIYKEIVFALRGYAGTFFGKAPKSYLLGGTDNWLFSNTNYSGTQNPLLNGPTTYNQNLLFAEFATNVRGFNYATQYGNSVAMANLEFRLPLIRALSSGPVASNFFRNLQFTAFYDIGSSWTGTIPLGNFTSPTRRVDTGPFVIDIKQYNNPWIYSYGFGLRTFIFGYFVKGDLAWPVINYEVKSPVFQFSLGFDF